MFKTIKGTFHSHMNDTIALMPFEIEVKRPRRVATIPPSHTYQRDVAQLFSCLALKFLNDNSLSNKCTDMTKIENKINSLKHLIIDS